MAILVLKGLAFCLFSGQNGRYFPWGSFEQPGTHVPSHKASPSHYACGWKERAISEILAKCQLRFYCKINNPTVVSLL